MLGEVEVRAVLNAEHGALGAHALEGAGAMRGEDVGGGDRGVGRLVHQPVVGLHQGRVGLDDRGEGGPGGGGGEGGAGDEPAAQAPVAEGGVAELELGPVGLVETGPGAERRGDAEQGAPVGAQGIEQDGLDGDALAGRRVAPAAGGVADGDPVGGLEAGAVMAVALDEGLDEQGGVAVTGPEVGGEAAEAQSEGLGGQVAAADGGADEEAGEVGEAILALAEPMKRSRSATRAAAAKPRAPRMPWSESRR